jgi:hypothetical protein
VAAIRYTATSGGDSWSGFGRACAGRTGGLRRTSHEAKDVRPEGNAQPRSDDARAAKENPSVRVSTFSPLCRPAFPQLTSDRAGRSEEFSPARFAFPERRTGRGPGADGGRCGAPAGPSRHSWRRGGGRTTASLPRHRGGFPRSRACAVALPDDPTACCASEPTRTLRLVTALHAYPLLGQVGRSFRPLL